MKELDVIKKILQSHEQRILNLEGKNDKPQKAQAATWYKPGTTIAKIISLIKDGYFKKPKKIAEILSELQTKDYTFHASDLTLPLRRIVRKGLLKKTKILPDGAQSKKWMYVEIWGA